MQTIQLHATPTHDFRFPQTVALQMTVPLQDCEDSLDDALALVLHAVRLSKSPHAMDALGTLLAYMENLERKQALSPATDNMVTLSNPITMSL